MQLFMHLDSFIVFLIHTFLFQRALDESIRLLILRSWFQGGVYGGDDEDTSKWPPWLRPLLQSSYFGQCKVHAAAAHKSECNMFCLDCADGPLCSLCLDSHKDHRSIQVKFYPNSGSDHWGFWSYFWIIRDWVEFICRYEDHHIMM